MTVVAAYVSVSVYGAVSSPTVLSVVSHWLDGETGNYPRCLCPRHVSVGPSNDFDGDADFHHPGHGETRCHSLRPGWTVAGAQVESSLLCAPSFAWDVGVEGGHEIARP